MEVDLPLPGERQAVRLLRDPYNVARGPVVRGIGVVGNAVDWVFAGNGRRLLVAGAGGQVGVFYIPRAQREHELDVVVLRLETRVCHPP